MSGLEVYNPNTRSITVTTADGRTVTVTGTREAPLAPTYLETATQRMPAIAKTAQVQQPAIEAPTTRKKEHRILRGMGGLALVISSPFIAYGVGYGGATLLKHSDDISTKVTESFNRVLPDGTQAGEQ